jgi:hypothetical protein
MERGIALSPLPSTAPSKMAKYMIDTLSPASFAVSYILITHANINA